MKRFPSIEWFHELKERANRNKDFQAAARWFGGTIGWSVDREVYSLKISKGQIESAEPKHGETLFAMHGTLEDWKELLTKGTINRLFRQKKIGIEGDKVEAMRYWKILWYLTEVARTLG